MEKKNLKGMTKDYLHLEYKDKDKLYIPVEKIELISKYSFLSEDILNSDIYYPLEGYLYPATYEFYSDATIKDVIEKMLDRTEDILDEYKEEIEDHNYSVHKILTIASIIEMESKKDGDRKDIASVIYNRLNSGMALRK